MNKIVSQNSFLSSNILVTFNESVNVSIFSVKEKHVIAQVKQWISSDSYDTKQYANGDLILLGSKDKSSLINNKNSIAEIHVRHLALEKGEQVVDKK